MITSRRSFITGLVAFAATAPAIVRATSIMPVKQMIIDPREEMMALLHARLDEAYRLTREKFNTVIYGNPDWMPMAFSGVEMRYDSVADDKMYLLSEHSVMVHIDDT